MTHQNESRAPAPHELNAEQLDEATAGATEPAPTTKVVRETNSTVAVLSNTTY